MATLRVGAGLTFNGVTGDVNFTGIVTATSFSGSGANLTGVAATSNISTNAVVNSGVTTVAAGSASAPSISPTGDSNTGIFFPAADTIAFGEGGSEAARIDSSGRFGLGTTSPSTLLHVASTAPYIRIQDTDSNTGVTAQGGFEMYDSDGDRLFFLANESSSSSDVSLFNNAGGALKFGTSGSERGQFDSSGRLLIGTSTSVATGGSPATTQIFSNSTGEFLGLHLGYSANAASPIFTLSKSRNNTYGSYTIVQNNDGLGRIYFAGDDGTDYNTVGASIEAQVDGTPGVNDMPGRLVFSTTADGASSPTERVRLENTGRFNIFSAYNNDVLVLRSGHTANAAPYLILGYYNATSTTSTGSGATFSVGTNGDVKNLNNSYASISDIKLKENIVDANSQWDDIKALQVRNYNFKEGQTHRQIGLIAQEVEQVCPGLVGETPDKDEDGNELGTTTKSVTYSVLYMKAVKALQEAMERIEQLEAEMAEVKAQLS